MPPSNPVIVLVKAPVPVPSVVLLLAIVGFADVLQHTPRAVTAAPPSEEIFPPLAAAELAIDDIAVVVSTGTVADIKLISFP